MRPAKPESPTLKARLKESGDAFPETFRVRLHRAISWLARAERESDDHDAQFVFLWIAFNAAYAREFGHDEPERERLRQFFSLLLSLDGEKRLHTLLHQHFTGPIRTMLDNKFVFEPFWRALRDVFPATAEQRCWWHKIGNVLAALPKSVHKDAKAALAEIYNAQDREHALAAAKAFSTAYGAKWPKATAKVTDDLDVLLAFYDFPAEHWIHLRTTNPIESTFATVRLRQRVTKGPGSRAAGIAMAFKLIESAQRRWRAVNAPHLVALVRAGATFEKGKLVERPEESGGQQHVA